MSLLEAAASGKLWQGKEEDIETSRSTSRSSSRVQGNTSARGSHVKKSTAEKIVSSVGNCNNTPQYMSQKFIFIVFFACLHHI